jgi:hypothetical protein
MLRVVLLSPAILLPNNGYDTYTKGAVAPLANDMDGNAGNKTVGTQKKAAAIAGVAWYLHTIAMMYQSSPASLPPATLPMH